MEKKACGYILGEGALCDVFGVLSSSGGAAHWEQTWLGRLLTVFPKRSLLSNWILYEMAQTEWSQCPWELDPEGRTVAMVLQAQAPYRLEEDFSQNSGGGGGRGGVIKPQVLG